MTATAERATLARAAAKRDAQLAERFAAAGYRFLGCATSGTKFVGNLTRYVLDFDYPERERWDLLPGFNQRHWLNFDGAEALDEGTGDPALLANLCALVRRRRYEKVVSEVHFQSGWRTTIGEQVRRARDEYGKAAAAAFLLAAGYPEGTVLTLATVEAERAKAEAELRAVLADAIDRRDRLNAVAPAATIPTGNAAFHRWYQFEKAQPTFEG